MIYSQSVQIVSKISWACFSQTSRHSRYNIQFCAKNENTYTSESWRL